MADPDFRADIEADAWRFYRWWVDLELLDLPDLPAERLIEMLERLPFYRGALYVRMVAQAQGEEDGRFGATAGPRSGSGSPMPSSPAGSRSGSDVERVESTGRNLTSHPAFAGLVEYTQV